MKNTDRYRITVTNRQTADGSCDTVTETGIGKYRKSGDMHYLTYDTDGTKVFIKAAPDSVTVKRMGASGSEIRYVPRRRTYFEYKTPYGVIAMSVFTRSILTDEKNGAVRIRYSLYTGDDEMENDVEIKWEVKTE